MKKLLSIVQDQCRQIGTDYHNLLPSKLIAMFANGRLAANPYWRLMRATHPVGTILLVLPVLWVVALISKSMWAMIGWSVFFIIGAFIMRSAGCIINDIIDRRIDREVERTSTRPLASGELALNQALRLLAGLLSIAFVLLCFLPRTAFLIGLFSIIPITLYPLIKRFSNYPQIFLGCTFNLGIFIAWFTLTSTVSYIPFLLYLCAVIWTTGYDTIYAHQDKLDDAKVGVKSMALTLKDQTKETVWRLYVIVVSALCIVGFSLNLGLLFYMGMLVGLYQLNWQVESLDINQAANCQRRFVSNIDFGLIVWVSILLGYVY